jgi:hypothetical protein
MLQMMQMGDVGKRERNRRRGQTKRGKKGMKK